jgi:replicative DNA helicase
MKKTMTPYPTNDLAEAASLSMLSFAPHLLRRNAWEDSLFFQNHHKIIFQAIKEQVLAGYPADLVAITSKLHGIGKLDSVGGAAGISETLLTLQLGNEFQSDYYFSQLVRARAYRATLEVIDASLPGLGTMQDSLDDFSRDIISAGQFKAARDEISLSQQIGQLVDQLEGKVDAERFAIGVEPLDRLLDGGMTRGELAVVAAESSGGKSVVLLQSALRAARDGKKVVVFSLEMPARQVLHRMACNLCGKTIPRTFPREPNRIILNAALAALQALDGMPLIIRDDLFSLGDITRQIRLLAAAGKCDLAVIDYLQLVQNKGDNREQAVSEIARDFKVLAGESKVAIFTASQLNDDGRLRESRAIGQHADTVLHIVKEGIEVAKQRNGPRGDLAHCRLRGELSRFEEKTENPY